MSGEIPSFPETLPRELRERAAVDAAQFILALRARGIRDTAVLGAMERIPREMFAPRRYADLARSDVALPLPCGQTMTAPGTVAQMLVALGVQDGDRVLEVGTGSGYVTALIAHMGGRIFTLERYGALATEAEGRIERVELSDRVIVAQGDGLSLSDRGERVERIILNGSLRGIPSTVTSLLAPGGRLVGAISEDGLQRLITIDRDPNGTLQHRLGGPLRIAPLVQGEPS